MAIWQDISFAELCDEFSPSRHRHVVMLMGSAISVGHPSNCLTVGQIRTIVLESVRDTAPPGEIQRIVSNLLRSANGVPSREAAALGQLPFEQFMGCLHLVDPVVRSGVLFEVRLSRDCLATHRPQLIHVLEDVLGDIRGRPEPGSPELN